MRLRADLTGQRFGAWVVIRRGADKYGGNSSWICKCDYCGTERCVVGYSLKSGASKSCRCQHIGNYKHGLSHGPEWGAWYNMITRCTNPKSKNWANYGGRGITVCKRWLTFENFYADMGPRPPKKSLDRIDNNIRYEPVNCRWATWSEQQKNRRRSKPPKES